MKDQFHGLIYAMRTNSGELDIGMTISVVNFVDSGLSLRGKKT